MLDSKTIKIVTPLQKHKYQMMEDGANFNIRRTKYGAVWIKNIVGCMYVSKKSTMYSLC